uniref:MARK3 kinase n=1 Tax=Anisakis simplex TaxID=6269 RepID=A0A0M3JFG4_ANISI
LPPPHLGGATRADIYSGGSLRSATASQSATPVSSHRHRIRPVQTQIPRGLTPAATPTLRSRQSSQRVDDFTQNEKSELQTNEPSTPPAGGSGMPMQRNSSASITQ